MSNSYNNNPSLFLYGYSITNLNSSIDFVAVSSGPTLQATLNVGYYSLTTLLAEIERAMQAADSANTYTATADRTIAGGLENRVAISTSGTYLDLLFSSGPRAASALASVIGFMSSDKTGATSYTGSMTTGTSFLSRWPAYNYIPPEKDRQYQGSRSVSGSGIKEALTFGVMAFASLEFMHETRDDVDNLWKPFFDWATQQREFDFTPDWTLPTQYYPMTLDQTAKDANGMGQAWKEEIALKLPGLFQTQPMVFRLSNQATNFLI